MRIVNRIIDGISNIGGYFSGVVVIAMMSLIMVEVFMRYVLRKPPAVADETSAYMLVGLVFIGLAYAWKEKGHVRIEFIITRIPARASQWIRLATLTIALIWVIIALNGAYDFVLFSFETGTKSQSWLRIPLYLPQLPIVIGFSLLTLQLVAEIAKAIRGIRSTDGGQAI